VATLAVPPPPVLFVESSTIEKVQIHSEASWCYVPGVWQSRSRPQRPTCWQYVAQRLEAGETLPNQTAILRPFPVPKQTRLELPSEVEGPISGTAGGTSDGHAIPVVARPLAPQPQSRLRI
jgi:hypothetical protein